MPATADRAGKSGVRGDLDCSPLPKRSQASGATGLNSLHDPASPGPLPNTQISWVALIGAREETRLVVQRLTIAHQWALYDYPDQFDPMISLWRQQRGLLLLAGWQTQHWSRAFLGEARRAAPGLAIVVLGPGESADDIVGPIMAGADGYMVEGPPWEHLEMAILNAAQGGGFFCKQAQEALVRHVQSQAGLLLSLRLSAGERATASLLLQPLTEKQIAQRLRMPVGTFHTHLKRLYRKIGVHSREDAIQRLFAPSERTQNHQRPVP